MADASGRRRRLLVITAIVVVVVGIGAAVWVGVSRRQPDRSAAMLCERLAEADALDSALVTLDPTVLGPEIAALERAVEVAPDDIRPQLSELADFVAEIGAEVRAAPTDKKAVLVEALAARQDRIDTITADGRAVELWAQTNCGASLRATSSTTSSTTSTTVASTSTTRASTSTTTGSTSTTR